MANKTTNYNLTKPTADDFYNVEVPNGNMDIIDAELKKLDDGKAPSGHGLGTIAVDTTSTTLLDIMPKGCGFYQVKNATDTPAPNASWINLFQCSRGIVEGKPSGFQLSVFDYYKNNPRIWFRTAIEGEASAWNEIIHTGNAVSLLPFLRFENNSYVGTGDTPTEENPIKLTFAFEPKVIFLDGRFTLSQGVTRAVRSVQGENEGVRVAWQGNTVLIWKDENRPFYMNLKDTTYHYAAIG